MKDQAQQPSNPNGATRGAGNGIGSTQTVSTTGVGTDPTSQQPAGQPLYDWQRTSGPAAPTGFGSNANDSFAAQGFSGVSGQPAPSAPASGGIVQPRQMDTNGMLPSGGQRYAPPGMQAPSGNLPPGMGMKTMFSGAPGVNGQPAGNPPDPTAPMNTDPAQYGPTSGSVDTSNVPGLVGGDSLGRMTQDSRDAAYRQATGYLDPQWSNQQRELETKLANQGVMQNSEAWNKAMDDFGRQKTFAYQQAQDAAVGQGNAAQAQMFGQGLAANTNQFGQNTVQTQIRNALQGQLANQGFAQQGITNGEAQRRFDNSLTSRNQGINELLLQQKNPLEMYNALTNGTNVTQPNFTNASGANVGNTDLLQAIQQAYGGKLNAYNAQTGAANSSNAGIASIIAALIGG